MSAEDSVQTLRQLDFKEINSACSKHNLNFRIDDYAKDKFNKSLSTVYLLVSQPIEIAISRETKATTSQSLKDIKKVLDALYSLTKDQKYKTHIDNLNQI